ncbi:MAG: CDP-glucose 4,6-dehydratase [Pseudomonadota bacterium]
MGVNPEFWSNQEIFITGHTGFKGSWLSLLLNRFGAPLHGFSLEEPPTVPSLFELAGLDRIFASDTRDDVGNLASLKDTMASVKPTIVFHLAAQPLVLDSYSDPVGTYMSNVLGTVNVLEAARHVPSVRAIVVITTDKCYEVSDGVTAHREEDRLGGHDPYSASKACAEVVSNSYRLCFFKDTDGPQIATARAGNVIGGGDWATNRLVPDCFRAFSEGKPLELRNPFAVRPWQHVLEPLTGYLLLAQKLYSGDPEVASAWNFGPERDDELQTRQVAEIALRTWGSGEIQESGESSDHVETEILRLDSSKASNRLNWRPRWNAEQAIEKSISWYQTVHAGAGAREETEKQIAEYFG